MSDFTVTVDPGHGGKSYRADGTVWPPFSPQPEWNEEECTKAYAEHLETAELIEDDICLDVAKELVLSLHGLPVAAELTRYEDEQLSLATRAQLAQKHGADLVIAIHVNAHAESAVHGADVFRWRLDPRAAEVGQTIADAMPKRLRTGRMHTVSQYPHWTNRAYNVLEPHYLLHGKPALLVELCYATNPLDRGFIRTKWGRSSTVSAIRAGICRFGELREAA